MFFRVRNANLNHINKLADCIDVPQTSGRKIGIARLHKYFTYDLLYRENTVLKMMKGLRKIIKHQEYSGVGEPDVSQDTGQDAT